MKLVRSIKLGEKTTGIYTAASSDEAAKHVFSYSEKTFFIIEERISEMIGGYDLPGASVIVPGGDENKNMEMTTRIFSSALRANMGPTARFVVIGGAAFCDMGSLVAALFFGGVKLTLVPTTLLAMAESSIGGRCGINGEGRRWFISETYPADEVIIDMNFLSGLPVKHMQSGMGEIIKHALLSPNTDLLDFLIREKTRIRSFDRKVIEKLILKSIDIKVSFLMAAENNERAYMCLGFGSRFGSSFILSGSTRLSYGEAVVWGMAKSLVLGASLGITEKAFMEKALELFGLYQFDISSRGADADTLRRWCDSYEKIVGAPPEFILLRSQGRPVKYRASMNELIKLN